MFEIPQLCLWRPCSLQELNVLAGEGSASVETTVSGAKLKVRLLRLQECTSND